MFTSKFYPRTFIVLWLILGGWEASSYGWQKTKQAEQPSSLLTAARQAVQKGQLTDAIALYRRVIALVPVNLEVRRELARLLTSQENTREEANKLYRETVNLFPQDVSLAIEFAKSLIAEGDIVNAILEYRRGFETDPESEIALQGFIEQTVKIGGAQAALARAQKKIAADPHDLATQILLAELLRSEGQLKAAKAQFLTVQKSAPTNLPALRGTAQVCLASLDFECANEQINRLATLIPPVQVQAERARLLLKQGRQDAAMWTITGSLGAVVDIIKDASTLDVLADYYRARSLPQSERAALEQLLRLPAATNNVKALERLARVYFELNDRETVQTIIAQLLKIDPTNTVAYLGRRLLQPPSESAKKDAFINVDNSDFGSLARTTENNKEQSTIRLNLAARRAARYRDEGEAALFWNQPSLAIAPLQSALKEWPFSPRLHLALGQALLQTGDSQAASRELVSVFYGEGHTRADALILLAQAQQQQRRWPEALKTYDYILTDSPDHLLALMGKSRVFEELGESGREAAVLLQIIRQMPEGMSFKTRLQSAFMAMGRPLGLITRPPTNNELRQLTKALTGQAKTNRSFASDLMEPLLDSGDVIRIKINGQLINETLTIGNDGKLQSMSVNLPPIQARCYTENELKTLIAKKLPQTEADNIKIQVEEFHQAPLQVRGDVYLPNYFYVQYPLGVEQGLTLAGGVTSTAGQIVYIVRNSYSCKNMGELPIQRNTNSEIVLYQRQPFETVNQLKSPKLNAGDQLYIPTANTVFVIGSVSRPSALTIKNNLTLLGALKMVGGVTSSARRDYIKLLRFTPGKDAYQQFILNLDQLERHQIGDVILKADDLIEVVSTNLQDDTNARLIRLLQQMAYSLPIIRNPQIFQRENK